jgi:DNA-binding response OmpR family regulator
MKKILVIDDEREVLDIVRSTLKTRGHEVLVTTSGSEGIRLAREEGPHLIICDLMMPEVSGLQVIKAVKSHPRTREIPFMVISPVEPTAQKPEQYWAHGLGVDEYLPKPFDPLDLLGRAEFLLRRGQYVSQRGNEPKPELALAQEPARVASREDLQLAPPAELVRIYNECWNQRDWVTEYACLSEETTHWVPFDMYQGGREQSWTESGGTVQRLVRVERESIQGSSAEVVCEREDSQDGRGWTRRVTYELQQGPGGWRVRRTHDEALRRDLPRILG